MRRRFADELDISSYGDDMVSFCMYKITVDEISGTDDGCWNAPMFSLKPDDEGWAGSYLYEHDGFPIDEKLYLLTGEIYSMNPNSTLGREQCYKLYKQGYYN